MHVVYVINAFGPGGAEILVRSMALQLRALGHQVDVISLFPLSMHGEAAELSFEVSFRKVLENQGVRTHIVARSDASMWERSVALSGLIRELGPSIVHTHLARALLLLLPTWWRRRIIVHTHHNINFSFPTRLFSIFNRIVSRYVAISDICSRALQKAGATQIKLIANGAVLPHGSARALGRGPHRLISVGRLTPQKSFETMIEAVAILNKDSPRVLLDIVGDGPERERLERVCKASDLGKAVRFLGTQEDVPRLLAKAELYVNSSNFEGLSISLLEAIGSGLPVVATAVGGTPEIVGPEGNGELVSPGDSEALAEAIGRIISEPAIYARMSRGALCASKPFTIEGCVDRHLELYRELLNTSHMVKKR